VSDTPLPPGQRARTDFPRFGLWPYADRAPDADAAPAITLSGDVLTARTVENPLAGLPRTELTADFHCVTTWSHRGVVWSGVRFADFYASYVAAQLADPARAPTLVVIRGADGYRTTLPVQDLLASDVLIADSMSGLPLSRAHGAPLRLVAPAHYGYKHVKHLSRIECWHGVPALRSRGFEFIDHPRARVALEERGRLVPGWILRHVYRPFIARTVRRFAMGLRNGA
jgi:DMSO/TMAO reductase YedYZ molybdopterin-dependent catalytic subunit